uniref:Protein kinase domain-containing protein n=1 Tax=Moniliophthora roreri TaxID=221103 RepID=A0A0W0GCC5_MONRR
MSNAHQQTGSISQNQKAQLANAYNELGKELSSSKVRVVGNYTLGRVIGEGAYGKVRIGTHRLTSTRVAIKQIPKAMSASLTREIHHHRQLHHPHITQMYEVIATESSIWIVTELCSGGELFDYLAEKGRLGEDETRFLFGQICLAVAYLHEKGIVHRDLKLENVLLDERCRVKLGDFGFTREYERGALMETFCGTTGYASPEMLQGQRYLGPEVDIWSLGVILYCLLTGMLPFDDDDEAVMRDKVIIGEFEDPEWLSTEARDLIKNVLVKEPSKRLSIPHILTHPWFSARNADAATSSKQSRPTSPEHQGPTPSSEASNTSMTNSEFSSVESITSVPTTPALSSSDPFEMPERKASATTHPNISETTIRRASTELPSIKPIRHPETVAEEALEEEDDELQPLRRQRTNSSESKGIAPPVHTLRTPARTKRRSVSSTMSDPDHDYDHSNANPKPNPGPNQPENKDNAYNNTHPNLPSSNQRDRDMDFSSLLNTPAPIIFSTPLERELLNIMNALGFDLGQIVYSVLNDACDAAGAVWWMLKRKAEKKMLTGGDTSLMGADSEDSVVDAYIRQSSNSSSSLAENKNKDKGKGKEKEGEKDKEKNKEKGKEKGEESKHHRPLIFMFHVAVAAKPSIKRANSPMLTPSGIESRSHPSTPGGSGSGFSVASSNGASGGGKGRKNRAGSVSIMQRATTALEAAGLVRKRSTEAVKEEKDKEREREKSREAEREKVSVEKEKEKEREREREREKERKGEDLISPPPRSSHGSSSSGHNKLTKSPPLRASKGTTTPPPLENPQPNAQHTMSPWILAESNDSLVQSIHSQPQTHAHKSHYVKRTAPTPANSPGGQVGGDLFTSISQPNLGENNKGSTGSGSSGGRNRANLLSAFRTWFQEERKAKRKDNGNNDGSGKKDSRFGVSRVVGGGRGTGANSDATPKRRTSGSGSRSGTGTVRGTNRRAHRPSVSSRRSSSVNSRRSSVTSVQQIMILSESPSVPRRSFGNQTPNSEKGDFSSRPSSIRSFSMQPRHRKSPSASSTGSLTRSQSLNRAASPMRYHRRGGSGSSSTTRVIRQGPKLQHGRSNSTTSSVHHSPASSRPTSFIEFSDYEGPQRTSSPYKARRSSDDMSTPRRGNRENAATFVAHRRQGPFGSPLNGYNSIGKSSWKKSWGLEPPGWQTRTAHLPVEVLAVSPAEGSSIRDVFSGAGRQSLNLGDESDWVDEDDDDMPYAGGLGQITLALSAAAVAKNGGSSAPNKGKNGNALFESTNIALEAPPSRRANRNNKRAGKESGPGSTSMRQKVGHSTMDRVSPVPSADGGYEPELRGGRRQLPAGRSGPAFKQAIQEEDEDEEEE